MKFEFGDLHRFLVSSGIALISLAMIVPWLFLKEPVGVVFTASDFIELEENSKALVSMRQVQLTWVMQVLPYFSGALLLSGFGLCSVGLWRWSQIQRIHDEKQQISIEVDQNNLRKMTKSEVDEKMKQEAVEEKQSVLEPLPYHNFRVSYQEIETKVAERVVKLMQPSHSVSRDYRIGSNFIDILVQSKKTDSLRATNYTLEVKYRKRPTGYSDIKTSYLQSIKSAHAVEGTTQMPVKSRLVLVSPETWDEERFNTVREKLYAEFPDVALAHRIVCLSEMELGELSDKDIAKRLEL